MLPVGVDDQRVQTRLGGRPIGRRYPFQEGFLRNLWLLDRQVIGRQVNRAQFDSGPGHASACGAVASSQSTSPSASAGLPTSIVAPRCSAPGFRFSRHTM